MQEIPKITILIFLVYSIRLEMLFEYSFAPSSGGPTDVLINSMSFRLPNFHFFQALAKAVSEIWPKANHFGHSVHWIIFVFFNKFYPNIMNQTENVVLTSIVYSNKMKSLCLKLIGARRTVQRCSSCHDTDVDNTVVETRDIIIGHCVSVSPNHYFSYRSAPSNLQKFIL